MGNILGNEVDPGKWVLFQCREQNLLSEMKYSTPVWSKDKSGILDADNKFKNILISFSRIADRERE